MRNARRLLPCCVLVPAMLFLAAPRLHSQAGPGGRDLPPYCTLKDVRAAVQIARPATSERPIDDVNWFARPVPNAKGDAIIAFASHNQNYLYNLTTGNRIMVPDRSDAVATPDGRFLTVPSHYTATHTVNFYDLPALLQRLDRAIDSAEFPPVFAHGDPDVYDVFYQSVGVVSDITQSGARTTVYRMMFSGSRQPAPPGFRVVDYTVVATPAKTTVTAGRPMRLCPEIVNDMATPFISKDGRYVVAHDATSKDHPSLKVFEITGVRPETQSTSCRLAADFGFVAGKADFSFDNRRLTFHVATHDYLAAFIDGGLRSPISTDVFVADLEVGGDGRITGPGHVRRLTASARPGVGHYFPAFLPDGRIMYVSNSSPKDSDAPKRFEFTVVTDRGLPPLGLTLARQDDFDLAASIGALWDQACTAGPRRNARDAAWLFTALSREQCRSLVRGRSAATETERSRLLSACDRLAE